VREPGSNPSTTFGREEPNETVPSTTLSGYKNPQVHKPDLSYRAVLQTTLAQVILQMQRLRSFGPAKGAGPQDDSVLL
jgi:hypothetical protein